MLKDRKTADLLMKSMERINLATANVEQLSQNLVDGAKNKQGTIGMLLADTLLASTIKNAALDIRSASGRTDLTVRKLEQMAKTIDSVGKKR
jgi:hypothetical protein